MQMCGLPAFTGGNRSRKCNVFNAIMVQWAIWPRFIEIQLG